MRILAGILLAAGCPALFAQSLALPGCEAPPEVSQVIHEKLAGEAFGKLRLTERWTLSRQLLGDLIAKHPRELEPHRQLLQSELAKGSGGYPRGQED
jgi:hypothetical protein